MTAPVTRLFGHEAAVAAFRAALGSGRLHHAWLVSGPRGVGKATFARAAALRALAEAAGPPPALPGLEVEDDHPAARFFAAGSHPDYRLVKREVWDRDRVVPEADRTGKEELARNIRVDQIRWLIPFLSIRPSFSSRRAIVIDAVDDMQKEAANALLKNLEEPPADTLFLLVSHAPERLLPTIRSRCRHLRLSRLGDDAMAAALRQALPEAGQAEIGALVEVGEGAPGRALSFQGLDIAALDRALRDLAEHGDPTNAGRSALAEALSAKSAQPRYEAFLQRVPAVIAAAARERRGPALAEAIALWERAQELAGSAVRLSFEPQSVAFELAGLVAALAPARRQDAA